MVAVLSAHLVASVREQLAVGSEPVGPDAISAAVRRVGVVLDSRALAELTRAVQGELFGLGPLDRLLADLRVTDVLVNGPDQVWIDRGAGLERSAVAFSDEAAVRSLAVRLAARAGRRLDDATPYVDARLPDGQRLHAVLPPLSVRGTTISLRIPRQRRFTVEDLIAAGTVDRSGAEVLAALVASRAAFLVSGGTGCGKTSVLGALLGLVPPSERIVIVEDTTELDPGHPHVVSMEARPANVEGRGEVPVRVLVRQALRMRPDRLVVGEVRGAEVVDLLAALNTGHEGGCGTLHANSAASVPDRLAGLALAAGMTLPGLRAQLAAGVHVVVHVTRRTDGTRIVAELGVVTGGPDDPRVEPALVHRAGRLAPASAHARLARLLERGP